MPEAPRPPKNADAPDPEQVRKDLERLEMIRQKRCVLFGRFYGASIEDIIDPDLGVHLGLSKDEISKGISPRHHAQGHVRLSCMTLAPSLITL